MLDFDDFKFFVRSIPDIVLASDNPWASLCSCHEVAQFYAGHYPDSSQIESFFSEVSQELSQRSYHDQPDWMDHHQSWSFGLSYNAKDGLSSSDYDQ